MYQCYCIFIFIISIGCQVERMNEHMHTLVWNVNMNQLCQLSMFFKGLKSNIMNFLRTESGETSHHSWHPQKFHSRISKHGSTWTKMVVHHQWVTWPYPCSNAHTWGDKALYEVSSWKSKPVQFISAISIILSPVDTNIICLPTRSL